MSLSLPQTTHQIGRSEPSPSAVTGARSTLLLEGVVVVLAVLVAPVVLYVGHLAPYERMLYPVSNFALAGYLFMRRSPWYVGHCLLLFCFVSLVRRLVDAQAGWDPSNPVLLTPYLCCLFAGISFLGYWSRRRPEKLGTFLVVLFCIAYGTVMAMVQGRIFAGMVDALKWSVGPLMAVHVLARSGEGGNGYGAKGSLTHGARSSTAHGDAWLPEQSGIRPVVEGCLVWAGAAMAVYGILQYMRPASWDIAWVQGVMQLGMTSIGQPEPFALRVFSTMNSPGSFGAFMAAGIVVGFKRRLPVAVLTVTLMAVGLALCQYRTIWAATALATLMLVMSRPGALRPSNILAALVVVFALCSSAIVPSIREAIVQRASTLTQLKGDESLESRLKQYSALAGQDENLILGSGLALSGASRRLDKQPRVAIDSGLIEIWQAMGAVVGTVFLLAIGWLVATLFWAPASVTHDVHFDRALVVAAFVQLPMGSVHVGELGFCGWLFLGLGLAALTRAAATRATVFNPTSAVPFEPNQPVVSR